MRKGIKNTDNNPQTIFINIYILHCLFLMIKTYTRSEETPFEGTIIDLETIGHFRRYPDPHDSRRQSGLAPTILGYLTENTLTIDYIEDMNYLPAFSEHIIETLAGLPRPFYAFNCDFESSVFYHTCGIEVFFDHELNSEKFEKKGTIRKSLEVPNYDDPYFDDGGACVKGWEVGNFNNCIKHNRACLLKERDILLKRGHRNPDGVKLNPL